jgi:hypothetical protein
MYIDGAVQVESEKFILDAYGKMFGEIRNKNDDRKWPIYLTLNMHVGNILHDKYRYNKSRN